MKPGKPLYPLVSGIGLVVVFLICSALLAFHPDINKDHIRYLMDHSKRVLGYRITDSREALFRISPQDKHIELLSNLDLTPDSSADTSQPSDSDTSDPDSRTYTLEIRILNSRLEPIHQDTFHEVTRVTEWVEPESGNVMKSAFYLYENTQACDSRITSFDLPVSDGDERFVAIRLLSPKRASASIRAYRHLDLTAERDIKGLRLMPKSFRTKLARHNLYGEDLTAEELARSMMDVLSQIPAETRQGFEYTTRQLFLFDDIAPVSGNLPPAATTDTSLIKPLFFAINGPASLTVELEGTGPINAEIWKGNAFLSESERTPDSTQTIAFDFAPGQHLLKLQDPSGSQNIAMVNLDPPSAWGNPDEAIRQPFPFSRTAYYRALPPETAAPVRIDLPEPPTDGCRMVKLVCRLPLDSQDSIEPVRYSLSCHYIDANGIKIEGGMIDGQCIPSSVARYDLDSAANLFPSMPERWHILPPAKAVSLEISATRPVDIALFSRLDNPTTSERAMGPAGDITHIKDVSYRDPDSGDYYFRPLNAVELAADNRKTWITIPAGLVESSQAMNDPKGNSTAVSCYPDSGTSAMSVFEPASATADDAMSYIRFNPGKPVQLTVDDSVTYIRPGFMYRLEPGSNPMISVKVDNLVITRFRPVTFEGYFEIPPVSTGTHIIQVSCSGNSGQIFMKLPASVSCNENHYNLRQAFRLDPGQSLTLPFHKPSWDATGLNILAYRHPDSPNPVSLRVEGSTMSGSVTRPIAAPTQPLIRFTGNPSPGPAQVLTRSGQTLTSPERFHYRMQDDQKPDTYTVTIESQTDTPVYLRFFTMTSDAGQPS